MRFASSRLFVEEVPRDLKHGVHVGVRPVGVSEKLPNRGLRQFAGHEAAASAPVAISEPSTKRITNSSSPSGVSDTFSSATFPILPR
jgi:hypothetical protein